MIRGLSKHGVVLLATLGILTDESLSISQPALARPDRCSVQQIENNIESLRADPSLVEALATCGSDALPILLRYLDQSFTEDSADGEYQRLLIITTLGQMGFRASSSARDLAKLMGYEWITSEDLDKAIFYTLWQINGDPTRTLFEILSDTGEDRLARGSALSNLQRFARDKSNLIPGGINPTSLERKLNGAILAIAENSDDDTDFRIQAFESLETNKLRPDVLKEIQNSIASALLKVIQD
ncbi:hypothetical protein ACKFKG_21985 [Phormidesmis sp. 146-35]